MTTRWIATGLSHDLPSGVVMAGRWHDTELAVWRSARGKLSAWKDRCPHRGMRLSHGFVRGETLSCIYHGWVYGTDGGCKHIPAHPALTPPSAIRAEVFSCIDADGVLWLAPADTAEPPPRLDGLRPVRSLSLTCDLATLLTSEPALKGNDILRGSISLGGNTVQVCLLVQIKPTGITLHALSGAGADALAVSRWLEALRFRAEEKVAA
jgi:nitrite reductase/ring-hydroxylating ferredoxin subunit